MYLKDFYTWRGSVTSGAETGLVLAWKNYIISLGLSNESAVITDMKNFFLTVDSYWTTYHNTFGSNDDSQSGNTALFKKLILANKSIFEAYAYLKHMTQLPSPYTSSAEYEIYDCWPFNIGIDSENPSAGASIGDFRSLFVVFRMFLADVSACSPGGANPCFAISVDEGVGTITEANSVLSVIRSVLNNQSTSGLPTTGTNNKRFVNDLGYSDQSMLGAPLTPGSPQSYSFVGKFNKMCGADPSNGRDDAEYKKFNRRNILMSGLNIKLEPKSGVTKVKPIDYMLDEMHLQDVIDYFNWTIVGVT
jgi:hypothetical protein